MSEFRKYGTDSDLDSIIDYDDWKERLKVAKQNYGLDVLVNDTSAMVRAAVARQGYGLDALVHDPIPRVRYAVAKQGYGFEVLIENSWYEPEDADNDDWTVKILSELIKRNYGLNRLVNHPLHEVRAAVAEQRYGLDILVNDSSWRVRVVVAEQGYGLDILVNDEDWRVRCKVAEQGYGLDQLIEDLNWMVRQEVASQGYCLDKLINDEKGWVRYEVAKQGYGLDILINDKDWMVRQEVARHGYDLNILVSDEDDRVRFAVARHGYGFDVLIDDEDDDVREFIQEYLKEHNYKSIADWAIANPDKVHKADIQDLKAQEDIKDFIYKIYDSSSLKIKSLYDNIDEFFDSNDDSEELVVYAIDTKQPIFKIQKQLNKIEFKLIVDITNDDGDNFATQFIFKSKEQLVSNLQKTIDFLKTCLQLNKCVDDLENCL